MPLPPQPNRVMPDTVWTTREGTPIEITKMASSHLLSTIHFIERTRLMNVAEKAGEGDMELASYYYQWPVQYHNMIAEAQRRNLIARGTEVPHAKAKRPALRS